jgi:hypothetical protein
VQLETPGGRGYSREFKDHEPLLHKFSRAGFARLQAAKINWVDYTEVFGQMQLYFVQAEAKYDPSRGFTFAAYLGRVCANNFNKWARDQVRDQMEMGTISIEDLSGAQGDDESTADFHAFLSDDTDESPEEIMQRRQTMWNYSKLSDEARKVCKALMHRQDDASINVVMRDLNMKPSVQRKVKEELTRNFGVKL